MEARVVLNRSQNFKEKIKQKKGSGEGAKLDSNISYS